MVNAKHAKAVIFDLDNTLYSYDNAHARAFQKVTDYAGQNFGLTASDFVELHKKGDRILRSRVGGETAAIHNRLLRYQIMMEQINRPVFHALEMTEIYWAAFVAGIEPMPGLKKCLSDLRKLGCAVGIGTNMTADYQYAKLRRLDILGDMDFIVTSEEAGAEKPDRKIFDLCVKKAARPAHECVFAGDNLELDALGARAAGLVPVWFCPETPGKPEKSEMIRETPPGIRKIGSLTELPALLESL